VTPATPLRRVLRIVGVHARAQTMYRADFIAGIADGVLWQTSAIVFASVILTRFPSIGSWSNRDVLLLTGMRLASHALVTLVFGKTVAVSTLVQEGRIDGYFTRPMSIYQQVQLSMFNTNAFGDLAVGVPILVIAIRIVDHPWTAVSVLLLVTGMAGGALMEAAVMNAFAGWSLLSPAAAPWSYRFQEILTLVGGYPLNILPRGIEAGLTFVVPIAFIAYLPAAAITGHISSTGLPEWLAFGSPAFGVAAFFASMRIWKVCLSRYEGANE
jgi:ABC-2 type transport system permease protein